MLLLALKNQCLFGIFKKTIKPTNFYVIKEASALRFIKPGF